MEATFYYNGMAGAPPGQSAAAGGMLKLLDACLLDGFNELTGASLVGSTTSGAAYVTATYPGHGYVVGQLVRISGADDPAYNGTFRVLTATTDAFKFKTVDTPATTTPGGVIVSKTPPLGWTKEFTDTNKAVYRPAAGNRRYLLVDSTPTITAIVRGYDTMSSITSGTGEFPNQSRIAANGYRWYNLSYNKWFIVGDDRRFYIIMQHSTSGSSYSVGFFGDLPSYKPLDLGNTMLTAISNTTDSNTVSQTTGGLLMTMGIPGSISSTQGGVVYQDATGTATPGTSNCIFHGYTGTSINTNYVGSTAVTTVGPSLITGGYHAAFIEMLEIVYGGSHFRFRAPGVIQLLNPFQTAAARNVFTAANGFDFAIVEQCGTSSFMLAFALCDWETVFSTGVS